MVIVNQLQSLFIHLQESERQFVDPTRFITSYRDPYGQVRPFSWLVGCLLACLLPPGVIFGESVRERK